MKKLILTLILLAPFISGCTNIDTTLTINDNKTAQISAKLTYEGNIDDKNDLNAQLINIGYKNILESDNYNVITDFNNDLSVITVERKFEKIDENDIDLSDLNFRTRLADGKYLDVKKNFFVTSYNIDSFIPFNKIKQIAKEEIKEQENSGLKPEYYQKYYQDIDYDENIPEEDFYSNLDEDTIDLDNMNNQKAEEPKVSDKTKDEMNLTFSIKLPSYAAYNNADSVNGTVYTWNIRQDSPTLIKLQYIQYSTGAVWIIILAGILLLSYIAYRIRRHDSNKRIERTDVSKPSDEE